MEIMAGVIIYAILLVGFLKFGRFLHECDDQMQESMGKR